MRIDDRLDDVATESLPLTMWVSDRLPALVTFAKTRFKLAGGQAAMIRARLNRQGRKLAQQSSPSVWANVTFTGSHPVQTLSRQITLTR